MKNVKRRIFLFIRTAAHLRRRINSRGQTLVEYALILCFISVVAISILINLGVNLRAVYTTIDSQVARAPGGVNYVPN